MIKQTLAACALLSALATPTQSHEAPTGWSYPLACCSNRDCTRISADRVRETPDGYAVTIQPGDHDFVTQAPVSYLVPYDSVKSAPDGDYHICISPKLDLLCFFAGARGF